MVRTKNENDSPDQEAAGETPERARETEQIEMQENQTERSYNSQASVDIAMPVAQLIPLPQSPKQEMDEPQQQPTLPNIPGVTNMKPGSKGRNFESFSGLLMVGNQEGENPATEEPAEPRKQMKVLVKLYKKQQAKIDEAENQK